MNTCGGCTHYEPYQKNKPEAGGQCYRNPPTISNYIDRNGGIQWSNDRPWVGFEERACGKFDKKDKD